VTKGKDRGENPLLRPSPQYENRLLRAKADRLGAIETAIIAETGANRRQVFIGPLHHKRK
jgi:hypothetical protein